MRPWTITALAATVVSIAPSADVVGMTWSPAMVLNSNASIDGNIGDYYPQIAHDGQGNWVCVWCAANTSLSPRDFDIIVSRSSDDGATWSDPALLDPLGADPLETEDDFRPTVHTDGAGHWVAVWYSYDSRGNTLGDDADIFVSRSVDHGATWTPSTPLNSDAATDHLNYTHCFDNTPDLAFGGDGYWVAAFYTERTNDADEDDPDVYISRSSDHGATWSEMELLHANLAVDSGEDTTVCVAADDSGNWVVTFKSTNLIGTNGIGDEDVHVSRSTDNGMTWTAPTTLNTDAGTDGLRDAYSGGLDLLTEGDLWVVTWVRELPPLIDYDLMIARSTDAGMTWTAPENLNPYYDVDGGYKDLYPRLGTDADNGWVVVWDAYNASPLPWGSDHDVIFMRSDNGAVTWSEPAVVNDHAYLDVSDRDQKPTVAGTPHGRWVSVWFSTHNLGGTIGTERDILYATSCVPTRDGDHDCDGDGDLVDFQAFQSCFAPSGPVIAACELFDFDADDDVDLNDFLQFEGSIDGP